MRTVLALCFVFVALPALAQPVSDSYAREITMIALRNLPSARCDGGRACAPATAEELRSPPILLAEARRIVERGRLSAAAEWCGLDWQRRSLVPLIVEARNAGRTDRIQALIALMHGRVQGELRETLRARGACPAQTRIDVEVQLTQIRR